MKYFDLLTSPLAGRNLIEASAGTGKTYTIASIYLRLLLEKRLSVDQILVVTFTIAATEELRDRIRNKIRELLDAFGAKTSVDAFLNGMVRKFTDTRTCQILLTNALRCFDEAAIFTIHGFCQRTLQDKAFECRSLFNTELVTNQKTLLREIVDDFWRVTIYNASPAFISYVKSKKKEGWNPHDLTRFAARYINTPNIRIIPEGTLSTADTLEKACFKLIEKTRETFHEVRPEVESLLLLSKGLNRNKYKIKNISLWSNELDRYLDEGILFPYETIQKFGTRALEGAVKKGCNAPQHPFFDLCDKLYMTLMDLSTIFEQRLLLLRKEFLSYVGQELSKRKEKKNIRSFDDLLVSLQSALQGKGGMDLAKTLRDRYPAALIDEFQDTDPIQYAIFKAIYSSSNTILFLIGDPKQAIYSFRGADIFTYIEAAKDIDVKYTLATNWRSEQGLLQAINTIFSHSVNPFLFNEIPFHPVITAYTDKKNSLVLSQKPDTIPFEHWFMRREDSAKKINKGRAEKQIAWAVAGEIGGLLEAGKEKRAFLENRPIEPGDIALLVRSNRQARTMQEVLRKWGIPSVLYSSESLFASCEAKQLFMVLSGITESSNESKIKAAMVSNIIGISGNTLFSLINDEVAWEEWLEKFNDYKKIWFQRGFITMARTLMAREGVRCTLLGYSDGERRLTNLLHCLEVLHQASLENKLGVEGLMKWFARKIEECPDTEEYQIRLETDEKAVKLITIHKSKGLEYPIVFCPFCWSGSKIEGSDTIYFHDPKNARCPTIDLGADTNNLSRPLAEQEILAENLRLLYVALTRAKYRCYLVWGMIKEAETSAPAYLLHCSKRDETSEIVENMTAEINAMDDEHLCADLNALSNKSLNTIRVSPLPAPYTKIYRASDVSLLSPSRRIFTGTIPSDWHIASFSSLIAGNAKEWERASHWDKYSALQDEKSSPDVSEGEWTMFDFPKGARAGTCLHDIIEKVDYHERNPETIQEYIKGRLATHGFGKEWTNPVYAMLENLFSIPLVDEREDFTLGSLSQKERVNEMEFYFPLNLITSRNLADVFSGKCGVEISDNFQERIATLNFSPCRGLLKGYIDLVFSFEGRYYLADWKSNYLGNQIENYALKALNIVMEQEFYFLQLYLYAVALHKYLARRVPHYAYETHFGAVFYIFLRGIDSEKGPQYGIYRTRPSEALLDALSHYLSGNDESSRQ